MIDPVTGAALGEALGAVTGQMAGQSLADAYNQRMTDTYTDASGIEIGVGTYTEVKPSISGNTSNTVVDSQESDPSVAFDNYETAGGVVDSTTGGFIYGSNVGTYSYSLLNTDNDGVKAVAPVSVPVETAYVAIAQALGLSMKVSEVDPILADKFARAIVSAGCVYDKARGLVTAWWDGVNMLFPKSAIDAVQQTIEENNIPQYDQQGAGEVSSNVIRGSYTVGNTLEVTPAGGSGTNVFYVPQDGVVLINTAGTGILGIVASSSNPINYTADTIRVRDGVVTTLNPQAFRQSGTPITIDGKTAYYLQVNLNGDGRIATTSAIQSMVQGDSSSYIAWSLIYGTITHPPADYPNGMWRSLAEQAYTPTTMPVAGGVAHKIDGGAGIDTIEVSPVRIDEDSLAGDTSESTVDPITANPNPDINQELPPAPIPTPIPDTNVSNPDVPLVDSSIVDSTLVDELVEELANTLDPQPAQSSGKIPFPFMPGTPVDPDDPSQGSSYPSIVPASAEPGGCYSRSDS